MRFTIYALLINSFTINTSLAKPSCTAFFQRICAIADCIPYGKTTCDNIFDPSPISSADSASGSETVASHSTHSASSRNAIKHANLSRVGYTQTQRFANPVEVGGATLYMAMPQNQSRLLAFKVNLHDMPNYTNVASFVTDLDDTTIDTMRNALIYATQDLCGKCVMHVDHPCTISIYYVGTTNPAKYTIVRNAIEVRREFFRNTGCEDANTTSLSFILHGNGLRFAIA